MQRYLNSGEVPKRSRDQGLLPLTGLICFDTNPVPAKRYYCSIKGNTGRARGAAGRLTVRTHWLQVGYKGGNVALMFTERPECLKRNR